MKMALPVGNNLDIQTMTATDTLIKGQGYIFTAYHRPFSLLNSDCIVPIHAGRARFQAGADGQSDEGADAFWCNLPGDDTGDNISARNNEFSECSVLYWMYKNLELDDYKYVGLFQYRRQLMLNNELYDAHKDDLEKRAYRCVHFKHIGDDYCSEIGLTDEAITRTLSDYDIILPYSSDLEALDISSPYEDWVKKIQGLHVDDLIELERIIKRMHPELAAFAETYLNSPEKRMYQIFIARPEVIIDYCKWLFEILFEADKYIDTSLYSVNGRRTLGYMAEILYGIYFKYMQGEGRLKIKECGVAYIEG